MTDGFAVTQLADNLWAIDEDMVRCFLIAGDERAVLIDSCMNKGTALAEVVTELMGSKPVDLVLTHADQDHTGGQEGFSAPLLHPSEFDYYFSKGNEGHEVRPLWEGDVLDLGSRKLEVVLVPGHTPGSLAFLDRAEKRLFSGDIFSDRSIFLFGAGRSLLAFISSLEKLESMMGSFDTLCASHGTAQLGMEWIPRTKEAAIKLLAGELEGTTPPREIPCKLYSHEGVNFLY